MVKPKFYQKHLPILERGFFQLEELTPRMFSFNSHVGACPLVRFWGVFSDTNEKHVRLGW
ncbi:MAG: hypothetical protein Ct9H300mP28_14720 [Pseudomonadota bacterium]|nr:MAG: hypothetical protein Ct9H300mP28_14720 [Pseudomonadota bacterium]